MRIYTTKHHLSLLRNPPRINKSYTCTEEPFNFTADNKNITNKTESLLPKHKRYHTHPSIALTVLHPLSGPHQSPDRRGLFS